MMKQKWGRIINCSSGAWLGRQLDHCNYCTANAGVVGLTGAVARELYSYGITCNAFTPDALTRATVTMRARLNKMAENGVPIPKERVEMFEKTPGAEAIGPFIAYLATDEAANITGTVFNVRGSHVGIYSVPEEKMTIDKKEGLWTVDELIEVVPKELLKGYENPAEPH
jgi:NAD(P)-dependent dehydrogenase (short-subunit alcohol dehydrogenase family)